MAIQDLVGEAGETCNKLADLVRKIREELTAAKDSAEQADAANAARDQAQGNYEALVAQTKELEASATARLNQLEADAQKAEERLSKANAEMQAVLRRLGGV